MQDPSVMHDEARIDRFRDGFGEGFTPVTAEADAGADFGIQVMPRGAVVAERHVKESVWVLLRGRAEVVLDDGTPGAVDAGSERIVERASLFDEPPTALHVPAQTQICITALSERVEWAVVRAGNPRAFAPRLFEPGDIEPEYRGDGLAQGTCLRNVRLIFDRGARPESNLVIGEVINYPGRWSSYPPHHHAQPEIYHYRFTAPQGYGHGEVGERVYKIRQYDTLKIAGMHDHAQVAAPGYGMYYLWIVRHLDGQPYEGFEFTPDHEWLLQAGAPIWQPQEGPWPER